LLCALQADAAERHFEAFRRFAGRADIAIGFADHVERQHRADLDQLGDLAHGQAAVAQRLANFAMGAGKGGQRHGVQRFDPGRQGAGQGGRGHGLELAFRRDGL